MGLEIAVFTFAVACAVGLAGQIMRLAMQAHALRLERTLVELPRPQHLETYPALTIVIPARNEAKNIGACLEAILAADYPQVRVVVADDDSSDETASIVRDLGERDERVHLVSVPSDPAARADWGSGKSYACWHGAKSAPARDAEWLLFLDADTRIRPDALWKAVAYSRHYDLGAFSASGIYRNPSFFGDLMEAMLYAVVMLWMPIREINDDASPRGWLNGQMILIREEDYRRVGEHQAIGRYAQDDLALAHHLKREKVRFRFFPTAKLYECLNYANFAEAMTGWRRLLAGGAPWMGLGGPTFAARIATYTLVWCFPAVVLALVHTGALPDPRWAGVSASTLLWAQVGVALLLHSLGRASMGLSAVRGVLYPLAAGLASVALVRGYLTLYHNGASIEYRGRAFNPHIDPLETDRDESANPPTGEAGRT